MEKILPFTNISIVVKVKLFTSIVEKRIKAVGGAWVSEHNLVIPSKTLYTYLLDSIWIFVIEYIDF